MSPQLAQRILHGETGGIHLRRVEPVIHRGGGFIEDVAFVRFTDPAHAHGICAVLGFRTDQMLTKKLYPEGEHGFSLLRADQLVIHIQGNLALIGVRLDLRFLCRPVHIPFPAKMDERLFFVPGSLVQVESVLAQASVKGDQSLLIFAVLAAFVPAIGGEVEQVPYMGGPQIGPCFDHAQHMFMVQRLVFLGVIALFRMLAVEGRIGIGSIFGKADDPIRVFFVIRIEEFIGLLQFAQIPAKIKVVAVDVGDFQDGAVRFQHEYVGHGGDPGGIQPVAQFVQQPMVFQQIFVHRAGGGDLVGKPPYGDAGMIIILRVFPAVFHVHGDIGNLRPHHNAVFIAQIVEFLGMLVMGQAQGVGPDFPDDGHIRRVVCIGQGVALTLQILVTADATQGVAAPIEEKALLRIDTVFPTPETGADFIAAVQGGCGRIQIGIIQAIPQAHVFDHKFRLGVPIHGRNGLGFAVHGQGDLGGVLPGFHRDGSAALFQIHLWGHLDARRTVLEQFKMLPGHADQIHRSIQPAVEGKIGLLGIDGIVIFIADQDRQHILFLQMPGQIHPEGGIAARVARQLFAIQIDLGRHGRAVYFQEKAFALGLFPR